MKSAGCNLVYIFPIVGPTCMQRRSKNLNGDLGNGSVSSFSKGLLSFTYIPLSVIFFLNILL